MGLLPTTTELEMSETINTNTGEIVNIEQEALKAAKLAEWYKAVNLANDAKSVIENEQALRKEVAALFFPTPDEGANTYELTQGYKLKLTHKIDRKLDEAALDAVKLQLREMNVNPDALVEMKPSLVLKAYKGLAQVNPEAIKVFDQALTIKPASPTLEVVAPKEKKS
jgi:hypothetical protein